MRKSGFVLFCIAVLSVTFAPLGVSAQAANEIGAEIAADRAFAADAPAPVTVRQAAPPIGNTDGRATVFFSDFEADNGGGVGTLDWEWGTYAWAGTCSTSFPPAAPYSGTNMWATVLNECYSNLGNNSGYSSSGACANTNTADDSILAFKKIIDNLKVSIAALGWIEFGITGCGDN